MSGLPGFAAVDPAFVVSEAGLSFGRRCGVTAGGFYLTLEMLSWL